MFTDRLKTNGTAIKIKKKRLLTINERNIIRWNICRDNNFHCLSMRLNIDRDLVKQLVSVQLPNKSRHLDELTHEPAIWSCDTGHWLSCFDSCQLTILWMSNIQDVDLPRHARDTPPYLLIVSPPHNFTICRRVRTYTRSVTWQPNEKRLTIFHEYGALKNAAVCGTYMKQNNFMKLRSCETKNFTKAWIVFETFSRSKSKIAVRPGSGAELSWAEPNSN